MTKSSSVSKISDTFLAMVDSMIETADRRADGLSGKTPAGVPTARSLSSDPVDTTDVDAQVQEILTEPSGGIVGDFQVTHPQATWLAVRHRADRARHLSRLERRLLAAGRLRAHAKDTGLWRDYVQRNIETVATKAKIQPEEVA